MCALAFSGQAVVAGGIVPPLLRGYRPSCHRAEGSAFIQRSSTLIIECSTRDLLEGNSNYLPSCINQQPTPHRRPTSTSLWHADTAQSIPPTSYFHRMELLVDFSREWSCSLTYIYIPSLREIKVVCGDNLVMLRFERVSRHGKRSAGWRFNSSHNIDVYRTRVFISNTSNYSCEFVNSASWVVDTQLCKLHY